MCGDAAHFPCHPPTSHSHTNRAWTLNPGLLLELGSSIDALSESLSSHEHFPDLGLPQGLELLLLNFAFLYVRDQTAGGDGGMGCTFHGQSPRHPPLCSRHFPRDSTSLESQSGFVTSAQILIHNHLYDSGLTKQHVNVSNLFPCSPFFSTSPKASRVVDIHRSLSNLRFSSNLGSSL